MDILSIIVCCRNEEKTINTILQKLFKISLPKGWQKQIIVIDNCSTDRTREILKNVNRKDTEIIFQTINKGKGNSVKKGFSLSKGKYIIPQDSDLEYDPKDIPIILDKALKKDLDLVIGSRRKNKKNFHKYWINEFGANFLTSIFNFLYRTNFTDIASCYKLMKSDKIKKIDFECDGFDLDYEIVGKFIKKKITYDEVGINYSSRTFEEGRKTIFMENNIYLDGFKALFLLLKIWIFYK